MDIDLVYTWVDGNDPEFRRRREKFLPENSADVDRREQRWRHFDELKYSLRSVAMHAPWFRSIFIVTNGQIPPWLNREHPKIKLVTHEQVYRWPEHLPTFNSASIETHLHRIAGLSEHFVYANDDTFLGGATSPDDFFTAMGFMLVHPGMEMTEKVLMQLSKQEAAFAGMLNALRLLESAYPNYMMRWIDHQMKPLTLTLYRRAEEKWPAAFESTSANRFRCSDDVALNFALLPNFAIYDKRALYNKKENAAIRMGSDEDYQRVLENPPKFFCVHDQEDDPSGLEPFLMKLFPQPCEFEKG